MCPKLTEQSYCQTHKKETDKQYNAQRDKQVTQLYKDPKWKALRRTVLSANPLCVECQKYSRLTAAKEVDHIVAHKGDPNLFFDLKNLQGLCKRCHSSKTAREDGRWRNKSKVYGYKTK